MILKRKIFTWYLRKGVILMKDNLENVPGMEIYSADIFTMIRQLSTYFFQTSSHIL